MKKIIFGALGLLLSFAFVYGEDIRIEKNESLKEITDYVPVDSGKTWEFTATIQGKSGQLELYFFQYDQQKRKIGAYNVNANLGTETVLTAQAEQGAMSFTVMDASKWDAPKKGNIVVFGAKEDLSDLPNFFHEYYVTKVVRLENRFVVDLNRGLMRSYLAGTMVRLHTDSGHLGWKVMLPVDKEFRQLIKPAERFGIKQNHWWQGTAFVRLTVRTTSDEPVIIQKWSLREVPPAELAQRR